MPGIVWEKVPSRWDFEKPGALEKLTNQVKVLIKMQSWAENRMVVSRSFRVGDRGDAGQRAQNCSCRINESRDVTC